MLASVAPGQAVLATLLVPVGAANLAFLTSAQSLVQLAASDHARGRVVGLYMLVFIGSGAPGGPAVGLVDEHFGARTGLLLAGLLPAVSRRPSPATSGAAPPCVSASPASPCGSSGPPSSPAADAPGDGAASRA